jgi:large subunit ribosomal protein L10
MSRRLKELMVDEIRREYQGVQTCLVVDLHRADGEEAVALRRYLAERGVRLRGVRNSMAARALAELGMGEVERYLEGPCALASGGEDLLALARALLECRQKHRSLAVRGGVSDGRPVGARQVEELAQLGSVERLRALVVGAFQTPIRQLAWALGAPLGGLASVLKQVRPT